MSVRIIVGDALAELRNLPDDSVQMCCTSPPYFGLRDYGVEGQIGLEPTLEAYIKTIVTVFREVRRVLRQDGVLFLNMGDSYAGSWGNQGRKEARGTQRPINGEMITPVLDGRYPSRSSNTGKIPAGSNLKPKDLMMIPARVAIALQDDGWWLRSDIIWSKPNPMPESVTDRPTTAHEHIFLLSRSERYYYDAESIRESQESDRPDMAEKGLRTGAAYINQRGQQDNSINGRKPHGQTEEDYDRLNGRQDTLHRRSGRTAGNKSHKYVTAYEASETEEHRTKAGLMKVADVPWYSRNKRSVWTVATAPFSEAHFATFPPKLIEPCILAGAPPHGVVLDPFLGSGTTLMVADRLGRDGIGIELNPDYAKMAERRCREPGFAFGLAAAPTESKGILDDG